MSLIDWPRLESIMVVSIRFDYVNCKWEITIMEDGRYLSVSGRTLGACFEHLKDQQLADQIKVWFNIH
jgi:6-phosphogluconolactonase (cycloisomerase 2 family)